jgi:glycerophosphoryl diester phosphodiesterase
MEREQGMPELKRDRCPISSDQPIVVAHRGLAGHAPENTLAAFAAALELRLGLEIDLCPTADEQIVVMHDRRLERTTSGRGLVREQLLAEIEALDAGSWFDPTCAGERVPTLAATLRLIRERRRGPTLIALDVKSDAPMEQAVCREVERHGLLEDVVGIGAVIGSAELRLRFKAVNPRIPMARLVPGPQEWEAGLADATADWLYARFLPDETQAAAAHGAGKRIFVAGPLVAGCQPENWLHLMRAGVDALLTDYPLECRACWRATR